MARLGADVIKVEAPQGDPYRRLPTVDTDGYPIQFRFLNSGKRTIRLDLASPAGQDVLRNPSATPASSYETSLPGRSTASVSATTSSARSIPA